MAHDAPQATGPSKLVIRNIGLLLSGAMEKPILDAYTIVAENGKISAIGRLKDVDTEHATTVVDAQPPASRAITRLPPEASSTAVAKPCRNACGMTLPSPARVPSASGTRGFRKSCPSPI